MCILHKTLTLKHMEKKTHWKKLTNPNYMGSYSLQPEEELTLTIDYVMKEIVKGDKGKEQECVVMYFEGNTKPMILNKVNAKTITKIYGTPYIEDGAGKKITIISKQVDAFGEQVDALRIKPVKPTKPTLNKEMPAYQKAVDHLKGSGTVADIEKQYVLTEEIKTQLQDDAI